ncbi:hypothetical protein ABZ883_21925 [Streptomyces sp. NPDC046977]|uniref:hypothetical protein n=1 Tax=Streptomyces sp. NPDC046977 TaxID=3154703 RepID=UPI0034085D32
MKASPVQGAPVPPSGRRPAAAGIVAAVTATPALRSRPAVAAPAASALFGLVLGGATYLLHGVSPVFERATNSSSSWIV